MDKKSAAKLKRNFKHMAAAVANAPLVVAHEVVEETTHMLHAEGELKPGSGLASGVFALALAILCFLGVLAFHFPQYLTTPELRAQYNVAVIRQVMFVALIISGS
ncbi:hypothetical protein ACO0K0_07350 [Undibacterium sp. SXout11W]|uniref:hypothetical protein n=1 Tax=Undibacterium sp. SXout11W TaxID=3413050 RepID=UPI003BF2F8DC